MYAARSALVSALRTIHVFTFLRLGVNPYSEIFCCGACEVMGVHACHNRAILLHVCKTDVVVYLSYLSPILCQGSINKFRGSHPLRDRARKLDQGIVIVR